MDEELQNKASKQTNLENLSKEELISKCKSLLIILKKAKSAKDDAVLENEKLKSDQAKVIRELEEDRNRVEKELETMQEVVTNLSENKMVLVTKNESLQRQLNVQISEVEALKKTEVEYVTQREGHLKEINRLRLATTKQQKVVEQLREERDKMDQLIKNEASERENLQLIDKIESLEAQLEQTEVLKSKCKNILAERDDALRKLTERDDALRKLTENESKPSFEDEKKAMEIVYNEFKAQKIVLEEKFNELKSQKIILEEEFKSCQNERNELKTKLTEMEGLLDKLHSTEESLSHCRAEVTELLDSRSKLEKEVETSSETISKYEENLMIIKTLEEDLHTEREKYSTLSALHEEAKEELQAVSLHREELNVKIDNLTREYENCKEEKNGLNEEINRLNEKIESEAAATSDGNSEAAATSNGNSEAAATSDGNSEAAATFDGNSEAAAASDGNSEAEVLCCEMQTENKESAIMMEDLRRKNENLNKFCQSIYEIFNSEENDVNYDELLLRIQNCQSDFAQNSEKYLKLKLSTIKLVRLVNSIFRFKAFEGEDVSDDLLITVIEDSFNHFEHMKTELKDSSLEGLFSTSSEHIKEFCSNIDKLKDLFCCSYKEKENTARLDTLPFRLSEPLWYLLNGMLELCTVVGKLLNLDLAPDLREVVAQAELKNRLFEELMLEAVNNIKFIVNDDYVFKDLSWKKKESIIDEHNQTILTYENDLKQLKEKYNEALRLKIQQEETIQNLSEKYEEIKTLLESKEAELKEETEKAVRCQEDYDSVCKEVDSLKKQISDMNIHFNKLTLELDDVIKERDSVTEKFNCLQTDLEHTLKKNNSCAQETTELNTQIESLQKHKELIEGKLKFYENEITVLKEEKRCVQSEYEQVATNTDVLAKDIISLKESCASMERENKSLIDGNTSLNNKLSLLETQFEASVQDRGNIKNSYEKLLVDLETIKEEREMDKKKVEESLKLNEISFTKHEDTENQLQEYINLYQTLKVEYETLIRDKESLIEKLDLTDKELLKLSQENELLKKSLESLQKDFEKSLEKEQQIRSENEELLKETETLLSLKKEMEEKKICGAALQEECNKLKEDYENISKENESNKDRTADWMKMKVELESDCDKLKEELDNMSTDNDSLRKMSLDLENELIKLKDVNKENEELVRRWKKDSEDLVEKLKIENEKLEKLKEENKLNENKLHEANEELKKSKEEYNELEENLKEKVEELKETLKENAELSKKLKENNEELEHSNAEVNRLKEEEDALQSNVKTLEAQVIGCVKSYKYNEDKTLNGVETVEVSFNKSENSDRIEVQNVTEAASAEASSRYSEIISELNEMNQIIRKRGEKISLLEDELYQKEAHIKELSDKLEELQSKEQELVCQQEQLQKMQSSSQDDSEALRELKKKVADLEEENLELKKAMESENASKATSNAVPADAPGEAMSTSTISKMEESCRMKELEDTFEERYMKLKNLAIKLKKKLMEQTADIKLLEDSKKKLIAEKEEMVKKGHLAASKNVQILQNEVDKLQDSLDATRKELKEREKQLVASAQEISDLKSKLVLLEEENAQRSNEIKNLEESVKCQTNVNESLQGQVTALERRLMIEEEKFTKFRGEQTTLEGRLEEANISREQLTKGLEEAKQESKKHSLIDLEIKDYERSIEDMAILVKEKDDVITDLRNKLGMEEGKVAALNEEISLLKEQIESETDRAEKLKKTVSDYKAQLGELRLDQETRISEREKDREVIESLNQEIEKQKLMLAELSAHSIKTEAKLRKEKDYAENKVELLEEKLEENERTVESLKAELNSLKKEFDAYKVRAQNVLRQKNKVPQQSYEDLKSEKEHLTADLETAKIRTHQLQSELSATKAELSYLASEKEKLALQVTNLSSAFTKKEQQLEEEISSWERKFEAKISEYQTIISDMSAQTEAMNKNYKAQLESDKELQMSEIRKLEAKLEENEEKIWQLKNAASSLKNGSSKPEIQQEVTSSLAPHHIRKASHGGIVEDHRLDVANMIREEGEGSEWVEPHPNRSPGQRLYNPPSLEHLLTNPFPSQQSIDESMSVVSAATDFTSKEVTKLEHKLSSCETRIQQLTTLLTESEAENAKLVQLSDTLKEEIRRASRNENREKHLENNEYLKNVVLKFICLKTGDERFRLVPVLKTLLQLSPDEASSLAVIAKGEDSQNLPQGWSNYLHLWSGR